MRIAFAVHMIRMSGRLHGRFAIRVLGGDLKRVLVDMSIMDEMKVAIMQIVPVVDMPDFCVPAIVAMDVRMVTMNFSRMLSRCYSARGEGGASSSH